MSIRTVFKPFAPTGSHTWSAVQTFSNYVDITNATDSSDASGDTGALRVEGGASIAKKLYIGTDLDVDGTTNLDGVTIVGDASLDGDLDFQGAQTITTSSGNLTITPSGGDLNINAHLVFATSRTFSVSGALTLSPTTDINIAPSADIIFKQGSNEIGRFEAAYGGYTDVFKVTGFTAGDATGIIVDALDGMDSDITFEEDGAWKYVFGYDASADRLRLTSTDTDICCYGEECLN